MNIIQEIQKIIIKAYQSNLEKALSGKVSLSELTKDIETELHRAGTLMVKETLETLDQAVKESKTRKKHWHVERKGEENTIATAMGPVSYKRTYYVNKKTKEYAYLSDELLGIEKHQRKDMNVCAMLVEKATTSSYQQAAEDSSYCGINSKTTVMNEIRRLGAVPNSAAKVKKQKQEIPIIYIEADEDHVPLQIGKKDISKIIYVHEGRKTVSKNRNKLLNVRYFSDARQTSEELWLDVAKYIRTATAHMDYTRAPLWHYITQGMRQATIDLFDVIIAETEDQPKRDTVKDAKRYVLNNWEAIQRQKGPDYIGCSAEGHVSHVLSARLSSRPKGWSQEGMEQMARLRVFDFNGGDIYEYMRTEKEKEIKDKRIIKLDARIIKNHQATSLETFGNLTIVNMGKNNTTSKWLKSVRGL